MGRFGYIVTGSQISYHYVRSRICSVSNMIVTMGTYSLFTNAMGLYRSLSLETLVFIIGMQKQHSKKAQTWSYGASYHSCG